MKAIKPREFATKEEMRRFEQEREDYLTEGIKLCDRKHFVELYKRLFLETFHPKYRAIKHYYEDYLGGYWRDEHGYVHAEHTGNIDIEKLADGDLCVIGNDKVICGVYFFHNGVLVRVCSLNEAG